MLNIPWYPEADIEQFPDVDSALTEPDGLLSVGGNLSVTTLTSAYRQGVFPWFSEGDPIMWWSPSERAIIPTNAIHISKNMRKLIKQQRYHSRCDTAFAEVVRLCGDTTIRDETWITDDMRQAYQLLHQQGRAHSIEIYDDTQQLVGGLYGVFSANVFCGESMFSAQPNTSKLALIALADFLLAHGCPLIDCQLPTSHLSRMGAVSLSRSDFIKQLINMPKNEFLAGKNWEALWRHYWA